MTSSIEPEEHNAKGGSSNRGHSFDIVVKVGQDLLEREGRIDQGYYEKLGVGWLEESLNLSVFNFSPKHQTADISMHLPVQTDVGSYNCLNLETDPEDHRNTYEEKIPR